MKGGVKMKSKKLSYNKILVLFCIIVVLVLMTGCNGGAPPIVNIFSVDSSTINPGESSTLTWSVSDATTVTITPDVGTVDSSGSTTVSPGVTTVYTLTATNSAGSVTASATVNVVQALPVHNLTKNTYYNTIQAALDDADSNNTIEVADGTYDETIGFPSGKKVILQSVNGPSSTTIRGDDNSSTVYLFNPLLGTTIEGFTITHAFGLIGGGIRNDLGNLTIYNCTVSNNYGSGIENHGTLTITGASTVSSNTGVYDGGGIYNHGTLTITGASAISGNTAYWSGGGIYNHGTLTITGASTISGNNTYSNGGGIFNWGTLTITASTISGNTADSSGGGIYIYSLSTTITASTISGNSADDGGGIYIDVSSFIPTIGGSSSAEKNTICGNYKSGNSPSLDQQIRDSSGDLYDAYKDTNYIYAYCE
jgi:parallel beta-helix repeat protein